MVEIVLQALLLITQVLGKKLDQMKTKMKKMVKKVLEVLAGLSAVIDLGASIK